MRPSKARAWLLRRSWSSQLAGEAREAGACGSAYFECVSHFAVKVMKRALLCSGGVFRGRCKLYTWQRQLRRVDRVRVEKNRCRYAREPRFRRNLALRRPRTTFHTGQWADATPTSPSHHTAAYASASFTIRIACNSWQPGSDSLNNVRFPAGYQNNIYMAMSSA